ncbi:MAG: ligase-associated DNA damage response exonuclease [Nitrospira sp.]|nr:ligase-associated DNA damage response exonuclease [Nitrospira sp.]
MPDLIRLQAGGLVGPNQRFHIDAWGKAAVNLITHAHGDHARLGSAEYWCAEDCVPILRHRLGADIRVKPMRYEEKSRLGDCWISFHPAGHIRGSAQIRIEQYSTVWVVTGDYKRDPDPTCRPFEPIPCQTLITEATFGLPIYHWTSSSVTVKAIVDWWQWCKQQQVTALLFCYALGKAQRILAELCRWTDEEVLLHGAVASLTNIYREQGVSMIPTRLVGEVTGGTAGRLILAPPSAHRSPWMKRFSAVSTAFASGWMAVRGARRQRGYQRGFVLSDHADWAGLIKTVEESRASRVLVTHGSSESLARFLRETKGLHAEPLATEFGEREE